MFDVLAKLAILTTTYVNNNPCNTKLTNALFLLSNYLKYIKCKTLKLINKTHETTATKIPE